MQRGFTQVHLLSVGIIALLIGVGIYMYSQDKLPFVQNPSQQACTLDAKLCPDGSSVGRSGPNCEFKKCPGEDNGQTCIQVITSAINFITKECKEFSTPCDVTGEWFRVDGCSKDPADWIKYENEKFGFTFKHPPYFLGKGGGGFDAAQPADAEYITTLIDPYHWQQGTDAPFNGIEIYIHPNPEAVPFKAYVTNEKQRLLNLWKLVSERRGENLSRLQLEQVPIVIAEREGVIYKGMYGDRDLIYVPFPKNNNVLVIAKLEKLKGSFSPLFDQIISSFKFLK